MTTGLVHTIFMFKKEVYHPELIALSCLFSNHLKYIFLKIASLAYPTGFRIFELSPLLECCIGKF